MHRRTGLNNQVLLTVRVLLTCATDCETHAVTGVFPTVEHRATGPVKFESRTECSGGSRSSFVWVSIHVLMPLIFVMRHFAVASPILADS